MTKVKFDGFKYYLKVDYRDDWVPFWDLKQGDAAILFGKQEVGVEITIDDKIAYLINCGATYIRGTTNCPCSGLWPNQSCGNCGGYGVLATF